MEAPPERPGHVGHTPQPIAGPLAGARLAALLSDDGVGAVLELARPSTAQVLPRLQAPEHEQTVVTTLAIERWRQRLDPRQPWPFSFRGGLTPGPNTLGPDRRFGGPAPGGS